MLSQDSSKEHQGIELQSLKPVSNTKETDFDLQKKLARLEDLILEGVHIPLTGMTIVDEQQVLNQLELIKTNLPIALAAAIEITSRKQEILQEAVNYARNLVESAQAQANQILNESAIIRKAELEAAKIRFQTEQECRKLKQQTQEEVERWRQYAITECQEIQAGADDYADAVLGNIEEQLKDMLGVICKGRQQLAAMPPPQQPSTEIDE
jgi:cell division septum initiation protein DivIVA